MNSRKRNSLGRMGLNIFKVRDTLDQNKNRIGNRWTHSDPFDKFEKYGVKRVKILPL